MGLRKDKNFLKKNIHPWKLQLLSPSATVLGSCSAPQLSTMTGPVADWAMVAGADVSVSASHLVLLHVASGQSRPPVLAPPPNTIFSPEPVGNCQDNLLL